MIKRLLVGLLGVLCLVGGGGLATAALWGNEVFDQDGVMRFDAGTITPGAGSLATIVDIDRFGADIPYVERYGTTHLSVTTLERDDPPAVVFIGAAATAAVDEFLRGSPYSVALAEGDTWSVRDVPGVTVPGPPQEQVFWLAQMLGPTAGIPVPGERPLSVVLMHPSGLPTGPLVLSIDFVVPQAPDWIRGATIGAIVLIVLGIGLLVLALRMRSRRGRQAEPVAEAEPRPDRTSDEPA